MKLIIISGPSGSGKTTLSKKISKKLKDAIILNTDNYYRTGIISQITSKIVNSYFDRKISFNFKLFKKDLNFILKNKFSNYSYDYDFKNKSIKKKIKIIKNIKYVIIEGIFGKEILKILPRSSCIYINLKTNKQTCMKRVIKRDINERGKVKETAKNDFIEGWELFIKNKKKKERGNYLKKFKISNKTNLKRIIKEVVKLNY